MIIFFIIFFGIILYLMFIFERSIRKIELDTDQKILKINSKSLITILETNTIYLEDVKVTIYKNNYRNLLYLSY